MNFPDHQYGKVRMDISADCFWSKGMQLYSFGLLLCMYAVCILVLNSNIHIILHFPSELLTQVEYIVDVELNITDARALDYIRRILNNSSFSVSLGHTVNVTHTDITTGQKET